MHSSTLAAILLPLLAAAVPAPQGPPCGNNLGQMPCTTATDRPATTTVSSAPIDLPTTDIVPASNSPESGWRAQNYNSEVVTCGHNWDCHSWCQGLTGGATSGWGVTCAKWAPPGVSTNIVQGQCLCYKDDVEEQLLAGFGDAICLAVNDAIYDIYDITMTASYLIPCVGEAAGAAASLYRLGAKVIKEGAKDCGINACRGHQYTVVDPNDFQSQAGILAYD